MLKHTERKRQLAYDALIFLGVFSILCFAMRLWPILLLIILGVFVMIIRFAFLSGAESAEKQAYVSPPLLPPPETEQSILRKAFGVLQERISQEVAHLYPASRWVWESPNAFALFADGYCLSILLNKAGGYKRALVQINNLMFRGFVFEIPKPEQMPMKPDSCDPEDDAEQSLDYSLIAFEWVEEHILRLNEKCNELIASGNYEMLLTAAELPQRESWQDVCAALLNNGFKEAETKDDGILVKIPQ